MEKIRAGKKYASVLISSALSFLFVFLTVYGSSTIGNNISTGGTLTVDGTSTLTGTVSAAGAIMASSSLQVTGSVVFYDPVSFRSGIGASSTAMIAGLLRASSSLQTTGVARFYDPVAFESGIGASSTVSITGSTTVTGAFNVSGLARVGTTSLGITSSSSPAQELSVQGDAYIGGGNHGGTTTVAVDTGKTGGAGCIQLRAADGTLVRVYASSTVGLDNNENRASGAHLVVEAGMCQTGN